jgi:hypothetical protein
VLYVVLGTLQKWVRAKAAPNNQGKFMTITPPPDDPAWAHIRMRYEQDQETVASIASDVGLASISLSTLAKRLGWVMRGRLKPIAKPKAPQKLDSTAATIKRVKEVLQQRLVQLEEHVKDIGAEVSELSTERQIRSANILVRTIEKVLDLERKDRLRRRKETFDFKYFDEQQRQQLAEKIERLQRTWREPKNIENLTDDGSGGIEQPVALLGQTTQATAATD